ncbi:uncharacterized protein METZ01_LOCUS234664 [marine metagenome]|uniref:Uncharacterized protein n=1 Tax=marine metagenome TaxID=408172 RepID=A0A382H3F8_9ZZZZ
MLPIASIAVFILKIYSSDWMPIQYDGFIKTY